mgnify:FL=1
MKESVCEVRTQDPENFDEEVLALVSAWCNALHLVKGEKPYHRYMHLHVPSNKTQGVNLLSRNGNSQTGERMTQKRPRDGWILAHSMHA